MERCGPPDGNHPMPTFVVQTLGKPPSKVVVEKDQIRIGREEGNDIVLPEDSVSREHAVVSRDSSGRWSVGCVSTTNPIVVNGKLTRERLDLAEGGEVLVGSAFLLVFSEDPARADQYVNVKTVFQQGRCKGCGWEGMVSPARKAPVCPRCNGNEFIEVGGYSGEVRRAAPSSEPPSARLQTTAMDQVAARKAFRSLKAAKGSRIERVDAHAGASPRKELTEDAAIVLRRSPDPLLNLHGFVIGQATVRWDGERYVVESAMLFPSLKVNDEKVRSAPLRSGDVISIGGNSFRFVTE